MHAIILCPAREEHRSPTLESLVESLSTQGYQFDIVCRHFSPSTPEFRQDNVNLYRSDVADPLDRALLFEPSVQLNEEIITQTEKKFSNYMLSATTSWTEISAITS